jgi:UDPglucose 6-dehydrogenase
MEGLWAAGATVRAFDPEAMAMAASLYGDTPNLVLCDSRDEAVMGADALIIATEWRQFRSPDYDLLRRELTQKVIFDGRNIYDPARIAREGFTYVGIGLPAIDGTGEPQAAEELDLEALMTVGSDGALA